MYIPEEFELKDQELVLQFLEQHPFGTLVVNGTAGFPVVVHVPFTCSFGSGMNCLEFHVAGKNPVVEAISGMKQGTMIVLGAHGYISSSVYTHVNVPTYNYESVHVSGKLEKLASDDLKDHLARLVDSFEKGRENKVQMRQWPHELMEAYMTEIVAFRIEIQKTEAAFKLSQNRNDVDFNRILEDLAGRSAGDQLLAQAMKQTKCPGR